ncbi:HipA domain-containing protein [Jiangella rhizosphaerae]|uniref:hypothetical protein n=1 Tax=Jiangella rhizosphaerae TaxID=2293569 RepID=UPI0013140148|nr:hypothetical protein [Jiangella rhizosphaerae]
MILIGDRVRLAPLYDLVTFAPYRDEQPVYSAMRIGGEYDFARIGAAQCLDAARTLGVDESWAGDLLETMRRDVVGAFEAARDDLVRVDAGTRDAARWVVDAVAGLRHGRAL